MAAELLADFFPQQTAVYYAFLKLFIGLYIYRVKDIIQCELFILPFYVSTMYIVVYRCVCVCIVVYIYIYICVYINTHQFYAIVGLLYAACQTISIQPVNSAGDLFVLGVCCGNSRFFRSLFYDNSGIS